MAGYKGYSMSNNAVSAYESGKKPMSKWTKTAILEEIESMVSSGDLPEGITEEIKDLSAKELKGFLSCSEWHHTSKMYNKTYFYEVSSSAILRYVKEKEAEKHVTSALCKVHTGFNAGNAVYEERVLQGYVNDYGFVSEGKQYIKGIDFIKVIEE